MPKTRLIAMRLRPEDETRINALCSHYGISITSVLRMLMKMEMDRLDLRTSAAAQSLSP